MRLKPSANLAHHPFDVRRSHSLGIAVTLKLLQRSIQRSASPSKQGQRSHGASMHNVRWLIPLIRFSRSFVKLNARRHAARSSPSPLVVRQCTVSGVQQSTLTSAAESSTKTPAGMLQKARSHQRSARCFATNLGRSAPRASCTVLGI